MGIVYIQVEEKLESGQGKTSVRRFFSRFCTPIFLEVCFMLLGNMLVYVLIIDILVFKILIKIAAYTSYINKYVDCPSIL